MRWAASLALLLVATGCGGSTKSVVVVDFKPGDEEIFDNAIDLVADPAIVEGAWSGDFERRVDRADVIAVVEIETLSSDIDLDRRATYRLSAKLSETIKGKSVRDLVLRVRDDQPGFDTVRANEERLLRDRFVAFIKWQRGAASGERMPRWHLSPASSRVKNKVAFLLRGGTQTEYKVITP